MSGNGSIREVSFQRHRFSTTDPGVGLGYVRDVMYVDHRVQMRGLGARYLFDLDLLQIGSTMLHRFRHSMGAKLDVAPGVPSVAVCTYALPTAEIETADGLIRPGVGTALAYPTGMPFLLGWTEVDTDTVQFDDARLAESAEPHLDPGERLRFAFGEAVSTAAVESTSLVRKVALANATNSSGALLADERTRLLDSTALTCFANTTMRSSTVPRSQAGPASRHPQCRHSPVGRRRRLPHGRLLRRQVSGWGELVARPALSPWRGW